MPSRRLLPTALTTLSLLAAAPAAAQAADLYVSPSGSDSAPGTESEPLRTLTAALAAAPGGETVHLDAGTYPAAVDGRGRTLDTTVVGAGDGLTRVAGLTLNGAKRLKVSGVTFTASVLVQGHPVYHAARPATSVRLEAVEFDHAGLTIKDGSQQIAVVDSYFHDTKNAVTGPGTPNVSSGITIARNRMEDLTGDGIQFGAWDDVRIWDNTIQDISDPAGIIHNDAIQLTGNSDRVSIQRNRLLRSTGQLLFVQDALGPIDSLEVVDNLLSTSSAVSVQSQGATHATYAYNTIVGGKDGGLWLRKGAVTPKDTVLVNNVASNIRVMEGAATATAAGNVVACPVASWSVPVPAGAACVADFGFVDFPGGDLRLGADSAVRPLGSSALTVSLDIDRNLRVGFVPGAFR